MGFLISFLFQYLKRFYAKNLVSHTVTVFVAISLLISQVGFAQAIPWVDVAKDTNDPCLVMGRMIDGERDLIDSIRNKLDSVRSMSDKACGVTVDLLRQEYYVSKHSKAFQLQFDRVVREEDLRQRVLSLDKTIRAYSQSDLHQKVDGQTLLQNSDEFQHFDLVTQYVRKHYFVPRELSRVALSLNKRLMAVANPTISALGDLAEKATDHKARLLLIDHYFDVVAQRDALNGALYIVQNDLLDSMNISESQKSDARVVYGQEALWALGGTVVVVSSVVFFGVSVPAMALAAATRTLGAVAGSLASGMAIGAIGDGSAEMLVSQTPNLERARQDSDLNETSFACELRKNQRLYPSEGLQRTAMGAAEGAVYGVAGVGGFLKLGLKARRFLVVIPVVAGASTAKNLVLAKLHNDTAETNFAAYRTQERLALADEARRQNHLDLAKKYLEEAKLHQIQRDDLLVNSAITATILFTAHGEIREATKSSQHAMSHIIAYASKSSDTTAVAAGDLLRTQEELTELAK